MFPIYFVVGLINIFAQNQNYGIKIDDPDFDVRVKRSVETGLSPPPDTNLNLDVLHREKRLAYYKKLTIPINSENYESQTSKPANRYDIFNPNRNFLFNATRNHNSTSFGYNRPMIRSYPYGYPPGYNPPTPRNWINTTPGYRTQNNPTYFNYQNPNGQNFAGYIGSIGTESTTPRYNNGGSRYNVAVGYNTVTPGYYIVTPRYNNPAFGYKASPGYNAAPGYNTVTPTYNNGPIPYAPRYSPTNNEANRNNNLAPYPPNNNNYPTTNNTGIHYLPYTAQPTNGLYGNIPTPAPYTPTFNVPPTPNYAPTFNVPPTPNYAVVPNNAVTTPTPAYAAPTPSPVTTTTIKIAACIICNIPCPGFMKRFGSFCVDYSEEED